jgi:hypothetical protein
MGGEDPKKTSRPLSVPVWCDGLRKRKRKRHISKALRARVQLKPRIQLAYSTYPI